MKWKKIKDDIRECLPKDRTFLTLWKGTVRITEYDTEDDTFHITTNLPSQLEGGWEVPKERERKFSHYAEITIPEDY